MRICNDGSHAKYVGELDLSQMTPANTETELEYHVHTQYDPPGGIKYTGGHYDPTYKCGGKSANQGSSECEPTISQKAEYSTILLIL